jgi:hypothetical protein
MLTFSGSQITTGTYSPTAIQEGDEYVFDANFKNEIQHLPFGKWPKDYTLLAEYTLKVRFFDYQNNDNMKVAFSFRKNPVDDAFSHTLNQAGYRNGKLECNVSALQPHLNKLYDILKNEKIFFDDGIVRAMTYAVNTAKHEFKKKADNIRARLVAG